MSSRTKVVGATAEARKKLENGYKPFGKQTKKSGCPSCNIPAKPGAGNSTAPGDETKK